MAQTRKSKPPRATAEKGPTDVHGRILLVEDNGDLRDITSALLRKIGYEVEAVATLMSARDKASERTFDVVIADIRLPDGSGLELMPLLRVHNAKLSGIAVSGADFDADAAMQAGFAVHLRKPFAFPELSAALQRVM
jgi:CheY-like chemotaxis protein